MTEKFKQKAKESATNYVQQLVDHSRIIENDLLLQCQLRQSHQDGYIAGVTEKCMCCDKVGKWRNYNSINEKLAQSYKVEKQLKSRLDEVIAYIKDIEEEKQGYQPICKGNQNSVIPPNTGSHIKMKKAVYTYEDIDGSYWEGFDTAKTKMEKHIEELTKENAELKERLLKIENAYKRKSEAEWRLNDLYQKVLTDFANAEKCSREYFTRYRAVLDRLIKAKEIILKLYNAGRDVLMCRADEKAYDNLEEAINDRSIEQFLSEVEHD